MKIGIDFGTSYSSAAVFRKGRVEQVLFNGEAQFRTSVFFPTRAVDFTSFNLTAFHEQEISDIIHTAKSTFARRLLDYRKDMSALEMRIRAAARLHTPMTAEEKKNVAQ